MLYLSSLRLSKRLSEHERAVANAQLKKALWGVKEWLEEEGVDATIWNENDDAIELSDYLQDLLLAAGMAMPE